MELIIYGAQSLHWKVFCPLFLWILLFQQSYGQSQTEGMNFFKATLCDLNDRLTGGCSIMVPNIRSKFECLLICMDENACIGSSQDENGDCFKHYECPSIPSCTTEFHNHFYVSKQCDNDGAWVPSKRKCQCVNGWVGKSCQNYPSTVMELFSNGYTGGFKQFYIDPDSDMRNLIPVTGFVSSNYHQIKVMSNWGLGGFNRSWADYRDGFRSKGVAWIGLKWMHALTQAGYTKMVLISDISGVGKHYRQYRDFRVSDKANGFSYTYGRTYQADKDGYILGNCLGPYQNIRFSTWDRDGDDDVDKNCASRAGSAWWYKACNNPCNMLGLGTNYFDTKPSYETMSALGIDIKAENFADVKFKMYMMMPN